jgi:hypothetical protein
VALRELRLDGALSAERDDYVYLVERNLSYAKLSPFITWDAEYTVELGPDGAPVHARLAVDAANTYVPGRGVAGYPAFYYSGGRWNWTTRQVELQEGYYGGYTSVYLPRGSQFLRASGFEEAVRAEPEGDLTAISGYVALPMGARRRLTVEWTPRVVPTQPGHYRLVLPRQPGAPAYALTVRVVLPEGARLAAATPAPASVERGVVTWRTQVDADRAFDLALDAPAAARR